MGADLQALEAKLGYVFRDRDLLTRALTHKSFTESAPASARADNEQLEFFGDSILGFLISEILVQKHPALGEGQLSRAKAYLVSARWLHQVAQAIGLGEFLQLGRGEELGGGRGKSRLLANAMEALIAALYLDGGIDLARRFVVESIYAEPTVTRSDAESIQYKGRLWERVGAEKLPRPEYEVVETSGPAHAPSFIVEARVGKLFSAQGRGHSKKAAEQLAARALLEAMDAASATTEA